MAGTLGGGVFVSGDRGASWGPPVLSGRYVQALLSYGDLVFAGTEQGIFKSSDRGVSWSPSSTGLTNLTVTALAASSGRLFAGTYGDGVFVSTDLGAQWQWISSGMYYSTILSLTVAGIDDLRRDHGGWGGRPQRYDRTLDLPPGRFAGFERERSS